VRGQAVPHQYRVALYVAAQGTDETLYPLTVHASWIKREEQSGIVSLVVGGDSAGGGYSLPVEPVR
jgi:hypothetical protein